MKGQSGGNNRVTSTPGAKKSEGKSARRSAGKPTGASSTGFIEKGNARYDRHDTYYRMAKADGFAARSVYKLEELDDEFRIIQRGDRVLDLGCAPGSWLQYSEAKVRAMAHQGSIVGIDLLPVKLSFGSHVRILQGDAFTATLEELAGVAPGASVPFFDVVLSDMAPNTTGVRAVDQARSMALCERALDVAARMLRPGGRFCVKVLEGGDMKAYMALCQQVFVHVKIRRPKGTRPGSTETYIVGLERKGGAAVHA